MINLPATVLGSMRATVESLMTDTCKIEVGADSVGEMGEVLQDQYTTVASGVTCRVISLGNRYSESARTIGEREVITEAYRLIVPYGTALDVNQRITLTSDSSVYQVVDLNTERTDRTDRQAIMVRIHG